jgi:hypothetical protein
LGHEGKPLEVQKNAHLNPLAQLFCPRKNPTSSRCLGNNKTARNNHNNKTNNNNNNDDDDDNNHHDYNNKQRLLKKGISMKTVRI